MDILTKIQKVGNFKFLYRKLLEDEVIRLLNRLYTVVTKLPKHKKPAEIRFYIELVYF